MFVCSVWSNNVLPYSTAKEACTSEGYVGPYEVDGEVVTTEYLDELCTESREIWKIFGYMTQSVEMSPSDSISKMTRTITVDGQGMNEGEEEADAGGGGETPEENNEDSEGAPDGGSEEGLREVSADEDQSGSEEPNTADGESRDSEKTS